MLTLAFPLVSCQDGQDQSRLLKQSFLFYSPFFTVFYAVVRMMLAPFVIFYITVYETPCQRPGHAFPFESRSLACDALAAGSGPGCLSMARPP
eukprot:scaffold1298_cov382-Prasinococcus_capsulatus_cf.AAC.10